MQWRAAAALHLAISTLMGAGDHIVASQSLYGGSHNLLAYTLPRFGITTTFVDRETPVPSSELSDQTKLVFGEVVGNPGMEVLDIPVIAEIAHAAGVPLMVDATFVTPYLCQPVALGADLVMHSATKFLWPWRCYWRITGGWRRFRLAGIWPLPNIERDL